MTRITVFSAAAAILLAGAAWAQTPAPTTAPATPAATAPAGPQYREFVQGNANAKVTVIEYASLTCSHCANFYRTSYVELKKNYIDTGKIKFVYRDFPLDGLAMAGALLARCAPGDRGGKLIDMMFKEQEKWIRSPTPLEPLEGYAQLAGMSSADVDACLKNEAILKQVREVQNTASTLYKVQSTPTFYIEDEKIDGDRGYEFMAKLIDKKLDEKD